MGIPDWNSDGHISPSEAGGTAWLIGASANYADSLDSGGGGSYYGGDDDGCFGCLWTIIKIVLVIALIRLAWIMIEIIVFWVQHPQYFPFG